MLSVPEKKKTTTQNILVLEPKFSSHCVNTNIQNLHSRCFSVSDEIRNHLELFPNFLPSFNLTNHFSVSHGSWLTTLSLSDSPPFLSLMPACLHSLASASAEWMALCQPHTTTELIRHSASGPSPRSFT